MNFTAHSERRSSLSSHTADLAQLKNEDRDIMAGNEDFLVTAFSQLNQQSELKKILDGYPIVSGGHRSILHHLPNQQEL